jgi:tetratricopeptide (TPR) repeat protein
MGREFEFDILKQALKLEEDNVIDALETAEDAQMIQEVRGRAAITFAFVHALVPHSIQASVRSLRRRKLHKAAAAAFELLQPQNFEALAFHHGEGGNDEKALKYYTLAAKRALDNFANQDAENLLLQALDLAEESQSRAELYHYLGRVLNRLTRNEQAVEAYKEGISKYLDLDELDKAAKLFALAVRSLSAGSALALALEGLKAVEGLEEGPGLSHLLERGASAYIFTGQFEEGLPMAYKALKMARKFDIPAVQVEALNTISIATQREDRQKAADLMKQAVDLAEQNELWREAMRAHNNYAELVGEDNKALQRKHFARAIELARMMGLTDKELSFWISSISWAVWKGDIRYGLQELPKIKERVKKTVDPELQLGSLSYIEGDILRFQGDLESALPKYQLTLETHEALGNKLGVSNAIGATAWLLIESGEPDQLDMAYDLLQSNLELEIDPNRAIYLSLLVQLFVKKGKHREARSYLKKAQAAYQANPAAWSLYWVCLTEAQLLAGRQEWDGVWAAYQKTVEVPVLSGYPWFMADTLKFWAEAYLARGEAEDRPRARELLGEALAIFEDIGASGYVDRVKEKVEELGRLGY